MVSSKRQWSCNPLQLISHAGQSPGWQGCLQLGWKSQVGGYPSPQAETAVKHRLKFPELLRQLDWMVIVSPSLCSGKVCSEVLLWWIYLGRTSLIWNMFQVSFKYCVITCMSLRALPKNWWIPHSLPEWIFPSSKDREAVSNGPKTAGCGSWTQFVRSQMYFRKHMLFQLVAGFLSQKYHPYLSLSCFIVVELAFIFLAPCRKLLKLKLWVKEAFYTPTDVCVGKDDLPFGFKKSQQA